MSVGRRYSVHCDGARFMIPRHTACRGWVAAAETAREARRIARLDRWVRISDPRCAGHDEPRACPKLDLCPPCETERKRRATMAAPTEESSK